jgi:hypothetical protein
MKYIISFLLLCLTTQLLAQESVLEMLITPHVDTLYLEAPCPPSAKVIATKTSRQKSIPIPQVCPTQSTVLATNPYMDTISVHVDVENNISIPITINVEPTISLNLIQDIDRHNKHVSIGTTKILLGLGTYLAGGGAFVVGTSRHYNFIFAKDNSTVQYRDHNIVTTISTNNVPKILAQQEQERQTWYAVGAGLVGIGTGLIVWGIIDNNQTKLMITPSGVCFKHTFKYKR